MINATFNFNISKNASEIKKLRLNSMFMAEKGTISSTGLMTISFSDEMIIPDLS